MDKSTSGIPSNADMPSKGSGGVSMYYGRGNSQLSPKAPPSQVMPHPSSQQDLSSQVPHPSSQPHLSSHQVSRPSLPLIVSCHVQASSPPLLHSPQVHLELELDGGHLHQATPTITTALPASSSILSTSQHLTYSPDLHENMAASGIPSSFSDNTRHNHAPPPFNPAPSWASPSRGLPGSRTANVHPGLAPRGNPAAVVASGSQMENGLIPSTPSLNNAGLSLRNSSLPRRFGHARHASLGNKAPLPPPSRHHSRHRSLGSISNVFTPPYFPPPLTTVSSNPSGSSLENLSQLSNNSTHGSEIPSNSFQLGAPSTSAANAAVSEEQGYDFAQHFNLFSQFTSNMALEYGMGDASSSGYSSSGVVGKGSPSAPPIPPVWCMDVHNKVLALGCKDGKIEVGGLLLCL